MTPYYSSDDTRMCTRCVMDTSDPNIWFNDEGVCSHCIKFEQEISQNWYPGEEGKRRLNQIIDSIKSTGEGREYDCIIGLSGGVDSSYLAYVASQYDLNILAVHVDAGWNSELAVQNIENIINYCGIDLYTHVVDWEEMRDVQAAFLRSGIMNQDIPQDHAFFAALYDFAVKNNIEWVLHGSNISTESILPTAWGYDAMDARFLKAIHDKYGNTDRKNFPTVSFFKYHIYYPFIKGMKVAKLLNYLPYNKWDAIDVLEEKMNFKYYGGKHFESRFTKFFQSYFLPERFGIDKRKAHLSSLILSDHISRQEALEELQQKPYDENTIQEDIEYVLKKLGITWEEFEKIMNSPVRSHQDFPNNEYLVQLKVRFNKLLRLFNIRFKRGV